MTFFGCGVRLDVLDVVLHCLEFLSLSGMNAALSACGRASNWVEAMGQMIERCVSGPIIKSPNGCIITRHKYPPGD